MLHLDFETRSCCDLIKEGAYRYGLDPTTEPILASFAYDDGPLQRWRMGEPYPFENYDGPIAAWNSQFERLIWNGPCHRLYGWPLLPIDRFVCVAATARANALPGKLDNCAKALGTHAQKDMQGYRHMMKMCRPKTLDPLTWYETERDIDRLHDYCDPDVETEREIMGLLRPMTDDELEVFWSTEEINDRGLRVDLEFAKVAVTYAAEEKKELSAELQALTDGTITSARQFQKIKDWLEPRINDETRAMMKKYVKGEPKVTFDASVRHNLITVEDESPGFLTPEVRDMVEIIDEAGNSSITKYQAMIDREVGGRVQGLYMAFGALQTGRWSSVKIQVHNLKRDVLADTDAVMCDVVNDEYYFENGVSYALSRLLRPTFIASPKKKLVWGDWSAIEARMLPFLCNTIDSDVKLALFEKIDADPEADDIYVRNAIAMNLFKDGEPNRQTGKVAELSLGYGGGVGAFQSMARNYDVHVDDKLANQIKMDWREINHWAVTFWRDLERTAMRAINNPYKEFPIGRVSYLFMPDTLNGLGALYCKLPCERVLTYPNARIEDVETPWGTTQPGITAIKGNWRPKADETDWPRFKVWMGLLAENITQAACASLLMDLIVDLPDYLYYSLIGHTHDEVLHDTDEPERAAKQLKKYMEKSREWARGLPLVAKIEMGDRYKGK